MPVFPWNGPLPTYLPIDLLISTGCLLVCLLVLSHECYGALSTLSYMNTKDKAHLKSVFTANLDSKDLSSVHYAVLGLKLLGSPVPKEQVCKRLDIHRQIYNCKFVNPYYGIFLNVLPGRK